MSIIQTLDYRGILESCVDAWNQGDAEKVASFYTEDLDYRDPNVPSGIHSRKDFTRYLRILFRKWPVQAWEHAELIAHATEGCFSACYQFRFGNGRAFVEGRGMDRLEFAGSFIARNWVYLNAGEWPAWIRQVEKRTA